MGFFGDNETLNMLYECKLLADDSHYNELEMALYYKFFILKKYHLLNDIVCLYIPKPDKLAIRHCWAINGKAVSGDKIFNILTDDGKMIGIFYLDLFMKSIGEK